jgi:hypothetical protein
MGRHEPEWQERGDGSVWILHSRVTEADLPRLDAVEALTIWNTTFPSGFLGRLPHLRWLDVRGGTGENLALIDGCTGLVGLEVNQVRGLSDLSAIESATELEYLMLYGLARLESLPDLSCHRRLCRVNLGQVRNLSDWSGLLEAPALTELYLSGRFTIDDDTVDRLAAHPTLRAFEWDAADAPLGRRAEVVARIDRPGCRAIRIETARSGD